MVRHEDPTDQQKAHLGAKLRKDLDKAPAESVARKKPGTAISATGEELKLPRCKMALGGGHGQR